MQYKIFKAITILIIFIFILSIFPNKVFADDSWVSDAQIFLNASERDEDQDGEKDSKIGMGSSAAKELKEASSDIYNLLTSVGMIIAVAVGLILGITFMVSSANDKANVKEALIPYVVGCIVIFGAFGIWKIVVVTYSGL